VGQLEAVAVSPDGKTIATAGWTVPGAFSIFLFELATGRQVGRIPLPGNSIRLAFSHDGRRLAATVGGLSAREWSVRLFDVESRRQIALDSDYAGPSHGLSFDGNGRIATTSFDGKLRLYDSNLKRIRVATAPGGGRPFGIAFSPDNTRLAVGYDDRVRVDVVNGQNLTGMFAADTHDITAWLSSVRWSPDGNILYAGGTPERNFLKQVFAWPNGGHGSYQALPVAADTISAIQVLSNGHAAVATLLQQSGR
jgi:WD40 repeat protein